MIDRIRRAWGVLRNKPPKHPPILIFSPSIHGQANMMNCVGWVQFVDSFDWEAMSTGARLSQDLTLDWVDKATGERYPHKTTRFLITYDPAFAEKVSEIRAKRPIRHDPAERYDPLG